ncbi:MAG TPA: pyridoxal phosphate-dependent aminotransferase [Vicinamibacteria bacterium]|nr:pyridoxal phosphate-dependent aminotransferase [Vicinamibacteria bacterium]
MTPEISTRGRQMPASPIRKLTPLADAAKKRGVRVLHLNIGQPDLETPQAMRDQLTKVPAVVAYSPSQGTAECQGALRRYYQRALGVCLGNDEVLATTGGSEAIQFALMASANPGDQVLVVEPYYTNYAAFAAMAGVTLSPITAKAEDGFHLPPREDWERAKTARTRALILCNPNNPTGTVYTREEVMAAAQFCRDHGLFLIADEVYREFAYDGRQPVSALSLAGYEDLTVMVDSLSKRYSACGMRLGCLVTRNRDFYGACLRMAQGRLSPPGLAQLMSLGADELGPDYSAGVVAEYQKRRDLLYRGMGEIPGVFLRKPEGAFYFVARLPVKDSEDFAAWLLSDFEHQGATVMVAPAPGFYATPGLGQDEVRIAYVLKAEDLELAVRVFRHGLEAYRQARGLAPVGVEAVAAPA